MIKKPTAKKIYNINIMETLKNTTIQRNNKTIELKMVLKYGHLWVRYNKELRPLMKDNYLMIESDLKQKLFSITERKNILTLLKNKKNKGLFEFINPDKKFKLYFDIDKVLDKKPSQSIIEEHLQKVKNIIIAKIPNATLSIDRTPLRMKGDKWKISYHIIVNNFYFNNLNELVNSGFKDWIKGIEIYGFDPCVYSKWREMKLPYQAKRNTKEVQEPLTNDDIENHIIGWITGEEKHINLELFKSNKPNKIVDFIKQQKKVKYVNQFVKKVEGTLSNEFDLKFYSANQLLDALPVYNYGNKTYWFILSWFIRYEGGSFTKWWEWAVRNWERKEDYVKENDPHYIKWKKMARAIKDDKTPKFDPTRNYIKNLLERIYGITIKSKSVENFFDTFIESGDIKVATDSKYMDSSEIQEHDKKYLFFNVSMGIGKTYSTMQYLNENRDIYKRVLWVCNRISLGRNIYGDINKHNTEQPFTFYKDISGDLGENWTDMNDEHKYARLGKCDRLICEVESLRHINPTNYDCVVADECESLFLSFMTDATHGQTGENYWDNFNNFELAIKKSKKVLLMDAYLSTRTTDYIKNLSDETGLILYNKKPKNKTYKEYLDFYKMLDDIATNIYKNEKVYMFYPYKTSKGSLFSKSIEEVSDLIKQMVKKKNMIKRGIVKLQRAFRKQNTIIVRCFQLNSMIYHGDISDKDKRALENVNELWCDKNLILTNSCISVGVSYNNDTSIFNKIYLCYADFILPRDIIQTSFRIRKTINSELGFCYLKDIGAVIRGDEHGKKMEGIRKVKVFNHPTLTPLLENMEIEYNARGIECMRRFMDITGYKKTYVDTTKLDKKNVKLLVARMKEVEEYKDIWDYENIPVIDKHKARINSTKINKQLATTEEKLTTNLFYMKAFFKEDLLECDTDTFYKNIWDKYFKDYEMVSKFMAGYEILKTVFVKTKHEEGDKRYTISFRDYKTLTLEEVNMIKNQIQLDKRYKYNKKKLQQKVIETFLGNCNKNIKRKVEDIVEGMDLELSNAEEVKIIMKNVREQETNKGIKEFVELYNNYGARIWAKRRVIYEINEDDDDELDIEDEEYIVNDIVMSWFRRFKRKKALMKVKKFRSRGEGEDYKSYLLLKSKYLN